MYILTLYKPLILRDVSDKQKVINHINFDDYFVNLATVLDLLRQKNDRQFKRLRDDLLFLQKNYKIVKKETKNESR